MCNFPDTFYQGCPHSNFVKPSAMPFPASPKAFHPNCRTVNTRNQLETSIIWADTDDSLPYFIRAEKDKENYGLIKYGIIPIDFRKAEASIQDSRFAPYLELNHDPDPLHPNPYHGNICFDRTHFFYFERRKRREIE